ncbi:11439_t:CDS:2, partial [Dentiscutata heterogama]
MSKSAHRDTKSHVSHISQDYCDVKEGKRGQSHELHDKYVHPSTNHDPKLAFNQKMDIERESQIEIKFGVESSTVSKTSKREKKTRDVKDRESSGCLRILSPNDVKD